MRRHSKSLILALAVALCLPLVVAAAAPQPQINPFAAAAPPFQTYRNDTPDSRVVDITKLQLDGVIYDLNDPAVANGSFYYLVTPEAQKTGVAPAFRTREEATAAANALGLGCGNAIEGVNNCIFCQNFNLGLPCAITACNVGVNNTSANGIRSFEPGCSRTILCTGLNGTGTCFLFTGTSGVINYTGATPLRSAFCLRP